MSFGFGAKVLLGLETEFGLFPGNKREATIHQVLCIWVSILKMEWARGAPFFGEVKDLSVTVPEETEPPCC